MKRSLLLILALLISSTNPFPSSAAAPVKAGATCSKVGLIANQDGIKYTCVKNKKKLVWDKGVMIPGAWPIKSGDISFWLYEGTSYDFKAPTGFVIDKLDAWFGNTEDYRQGASVSNIFADALGKRTYKFVASDHLLGNPAPKTLKRLYVSIYLSQRQADCKVNIATQTADCVIGDRLVGSFVAFESFKSAALYQNIGLRNVFIGNGTANTMPWGPSADVYCGVNQKGGSALWVCPSLEVATAEILPGTAKYFWEVDGGRTPEFTINWSAK